MAILDYVIIGILAVGLIAGLIKGFIKQLLALLGIFAISIGTAYLYVYPQQWLSGVLDGLWLTVVSIAATLIVISVVYGLLSFFIQKAFKAVKIIKILDRILGAIVGVAISYAVIAIVVGLFQHTGEDFLPTIRSFVVEQMESSVLVQTVFTPNFFGDWIMEVIRNGLGSIIIE